MLDASVTLSSVKLFVTIKVWADTIFGYSLMLSFTAFKELSFVFKFCILADSVT